MNSLSKLQVFMVGFLLLMLGGLLIEVLLIIPALLFFALHFPLIKGQLRREYPEDWMKYGLVFIIYELILLSVFYTLSTYSLSLTDLSGIYNVFIVFIVILISIMIIRFFVGRRYCYGKVLFSTKGWVGVHIKSDLFSKIKEANYAVENPMDLKVRNGDRVKVHTHGGIGKSVPYEVVEIVK